MVGEGFGPPGQAEDLDPLLDERGSVFPRDAEGLELLDAVAQADTEDQPAAGDRVDDGGVLGDAQRVMQGKQQHPRADVDAAGAGGNGGGRREQRGAVAVIEEVMLGEPDVIVAHRLGGSGLIEDLAVDLRPRPAEAAGVRAVEDDAEAGGGVAHVGSSHCAASFPAPRRSRTIRPVAAISHPEGEAGNRGD